MHHVVIQSLKKLIMMSTFKKGESKMASKLSDGRQWKSTELKGKDVGKFREYCRDMHLNFETSEVEYGYTHFEVLVSLEELWDANEFLLNL